MLPLQGAWVQSLIRELRSHMPHGVAKKKNTGGGVRGRNDRSYMIISTDTEKEFYKIQHPFMIKTLTKVSIEGIYLDIIKAIYGLPSWCSG